MQHAILSKRLIFKFLWAYFAYFDGTRVWCLYPGSSPGTFEACLSCQCPPTCPISLNLSSSNSKEWIKENIEKTISQNVSAINIYFSRCLPGQSSPSLFSFFQEFFHLRNLCKAVIFGFPTCASIPSRARRSSFWRSAITSSVLSFPDPSSHLSSSLQPDKVNKEIYVANQ